MLLKDQKICRPNYREFVVPITHEQGLIANTGSNRLQQTFCETVVKRYTVLLLPEAKEHGPPQVFLGFKKLFRMIYRSHLVHSTEGVPIHTTQIICK